MTTTTDRELIDILALEPGDIVEDVYGNPAIVRALVGDRSSYGGRFLRVDITQLVGSDRGRHAAAPVKDGKTVRVTAGSERHEWAQGVASRLAR